MDEIYRLKEKIINIINRNPNSEIAQEFKNALSDLNQIIDSSVIKQKDGIVNKFIVFMRSKFFKQDKPEIDITKYNEIKQRIIQLFYEKNVFPKFSGKMDKNYRLFRGFKIGEFESFIKEFEDYQNFKTRLKTDSDGKIEIYPWDTDKVEIIDDINKELLKISEQCLFNDITVEEAIKQRSDYYSNKNGVIKNHFMQSDVSHYYGTPEFICERSQYILECMNNILMNRDIDSKYKLKTEQCIEHAINLVNEIQVYTEILSNKRDYKTYDKLKNSFCKLLKYEDYISKDVAQIWKQYLTDPKDYKEGEPFSFLVHAFSGEIDTLRPMNKCCCTLVTEKCMPIPYGDYGVICEFNSDNIGTMCVEDAGSWRVSKRQFIDRNMPNTWQLAEKLWNSDEYVWYEYPKISKLILPAIMEQKMIDNNIRCNSDGQQFEAYTEIFMNKGKNGEEIPIKNLFFIGESGKRKVEQINNKFNPIELDPSKGTIVQFNLKEIKNRD